MHAFLWGFIVGALAGLAACYFGASRAIAEYKKAAAEAGVVFHTLEGKLTAVKKAL